MECQTVNKIDLVMPVLRHEEPDEVPRNIVFTDTNSQMKHLGAVSDIAIPDSGRCMLPDTWGAG